MWNLFGAVLLSASANLLDGGAFTPASALSVLIANTPPNIAANLGQDIVAAQAVQNLLSTLQKAGYSSAGQGVWIQSHNGVLLASHQAMQPLPAASLTKIATTLAVLSTWEPGYQVITTVSAKGKIVGDTIQGDLLVDGNGDPFFVWEEAIALGNALNQLGIKRVQGDLVIAGPFYMNFETDPKLSGSLLKQALNADRWTNEILGQYRTLPPGTPKPRLTVSGNIRTQASLSSAVELSTIPLVRHASLPLWRILKLMNTYSNNAMAEMLGTAVGGPRAIVQKIASATGISLAEIRLINGSGLGQQNQISPHAVVAMLIALHNRVQPLGLSLADIFPMSNCHCGTLESRNMPLETIAKTGTLSDVSALAGVFQTRDRGPIWFAILNRGEGDIGFFHEAQDRVLRTLVTKWGQQQGRTASLLTPVFSPIPWQDTNRNELMLKRN